MDMQLTGRPNNRRPGSIMAFLQARMGSTRLPGKVMMPICGKSILERAILRLRAAPVVQEVAVLTTFLDQDDVIVQEASRLGARIYRGPEQDVLLRFREAAEKFKPSIVIRATADNPLIDIGSIGRIVHSLKSGKLDLCMEVGLPYGAATEACTAESLAKADALAQAARDREHVTLYIKERPGEFRVGFRNAPESLYYPDVRVTVDTREDITFMERLLACLPEEDGPIPLREYIPFALRFAGVSGAEQRPNMFKAKSL